jgi:hypothetical protein
LFEIGLRLGQGVASRGLLVGQIEILERLVGVGAAAVVVCETLVELLESVGVQRFEGSARPFVIGLPPRSQQRVVDGLLGEDVLEGVLPLRGQARRVDELEVLELQELPAQDAVSCATAVSSG